MWMWFKKLLKRRYAYAIEPLKTLTLEETVWNTYQNLKRDRVGIKRRKAQKLRN